MKLKEKLREIFEHKYLLTPSKKAISQTERNDLKYELTEIVADLITKASEEMDLVITKTIDGYIMEVQNKELGMIPVELIMKVRGLDYDIFGQEQAYLDKIKEKE